MSRKDKLVETAKELMMINEQIKDLEKIKSSLNERMRIIFNHAKEEGSSTYREEGFEVCITTGFNYSLDKGKYKVMKGQINSVFNPVKEKVSYELDKTIIRDCEKYGDVADKIALSEVLKKTPKKLYVTVKKEDALEVVEVDFGRIAI